jgi:hypothetical protein
MLCDRPIGGSIAADRPGDGHRRYGVVVKAAAAGMLGAAAARCLVLSTAPPISAAFHEGHLCHLCAAAALGTPPRVESGAGSGRRAGADGW